ncbi:MAG: citrate lyase subunit alpha, partial [Mycoplasma sp.]|nr:citrate lyase subunit alpha [Mycoplasma sp.]
MNKIIKNEITRSKIVDLETAIKNVGLKDGDVISFHHHFRNGDKTMQLVIDAISKLKIKNLTIASSSLTGAHNFLIDYIKDGTITGLETSGCRGKLGEFISHGNLKNPMIIRSHGGRARAIKNGDLKIDVAFLGVSSADEMGNANGVIGKSICGALGYAIVDSKYAKNTIVLTDHIVSYPNPIVSISQIDVDYVVKVKEIGDSSKIMSGEIRLTSNPKEEVIAKNIAQVVTNLPWFKDGFSMQMGTGGASLSAIKEIKTKMIEKGYKAGFCLGGITSHQVKLLEENLTNLLIDVQSFDLGAAESLLKNEKHIEIDADMYANPFNKSPYCNKLDFVILSALEVDVNFNVNVITGSDGVIRGASGGHSDTAMGAKVSIVALPLFRGRIPCITNK